MALAGGLVDDEEGAALDLGEDFVDLGAGEGEAGTPGETADFLAEVGGAAVEGAREGLG